MSSLAPWWRLLARLPGGSTAVARVASASPAARPTVLLTGAAGNVARLVRPALAELAEELRLSDRQHVPPAAANERSVPAQLEDAVAVEQAVAGSNAIVHLGGIAKEAAWEALIASNLRGTINVLEAARRHGVGRVVLASSMHVMGFHERADDFSEDSPPRPDSRYAASKLCTEAVGRLFAEKYGIAVTCIRIGHVTERREQAEPGNWIAAADLARLIRLGVERPAPGFTLLHGVAGYDGCRISDGRLPRAFGFNFLGRGGSYAQAMRRLPATYPGNPRAQQLRGGVFAAGDHDMV
jgi:uronate dehydrogenase